MQPMFLVAIGIHECVCVSVFPGLLAGAGRCYNDRHELFFDPR